MNDSSITYDDLSLGPVYPNKNQYTELQLITFATHLTKLRYNFTEIQEQLKSTNSEDAETIRIILFDSLLLRAQIYLNQKIHSKNILLRMLQRFITCLNEQNVYVNYNDWFFIKPELIINTDEPVEKKQRK